MRLVSFVKGAGVMVAEHGQVEIPQAAKSRLDIDPDTGVDGYAPAGDKTPPNGELDDARHPVERVYGILGKPGSTDEYMAEIRGR